MSWILVGLGGTLGSMARYGFGNVISRKVKSWYPWATFIINILGSMILGILSATDIERNLYMFFSVGFLGAFTTFSTFINESVCLIKKNELKKSLFYIILSIIFGLLAFILGMFLGER